MNKNWKTVIWIFIVFYICILVTYHRFSGISVILGSIPSLITSFATLLGVIIAIFTYLRNIRSNRSKTAYDAYHETISNLINVLSSNQDLSFKLFSISFCYDSLVKIEPHIKDQEHIDILISSHIGLQYQIKKTLNSIKINEYFSYNTEDINKFDSTITSCADVLCCYWQQHILGKSRFFINAQGIVDAFGAPGFTLNHDYLLKSLALMIGVPGRICESESIINTLVNSVSSLNNFKLYKAYKTVIHCPMTLAFLMLLNQTYVDDFKLKLKDIYSEDTWINHQFNMISYNPQGIPSYFQRCV